MSITPGPWKWDGELFIWGPHDGEMIAEVRGWGYLTGLMRMSPDEAEKVQQANGLAISLVPEMLEVVGLLVNGFVDQAFLKARALVPKLTPPGEGEVGGVSQWCGVYLMDTRYCGCSLEEEYSLGFKEGVMWAKAVAYCRWYAYYPSEELSFLVLWDQSLEEGR